MPISTRLTVPERIAMATFLVFILLCAIGIGLILSLFPASTPSTPSGNVDVSASESHLESSSVPEVVMREPVSVVFLGDVMLDRLVAQRTVQSKRPGYAFELVQSSALFSDDVITVANLEGPVGEKRLPPVKSIDFLFAPETVSVLRNIGIDAVSQANNHTLDQGRVGADRSVQLLKEGGLEVFGDQSRVSTTSSLAIISTRGWRIALVGLNTTNGAQEEVEMRSVLDTARLSADRVVVFLHWGEEYQDFPGKTEVEFSHWLIDQGADAVVGSHPHWMQGISIWKGKPIMYSLGNFVFDQDWSVETKEGLSVKLDFSETGFTLTPIPIHIERSQPQILEGKARQERLDRLAEISDEALKSQIRDGKITNP